MKDRWDAAEAYDPYVGRWSRLLAPSFLRWARIPVDGTILDVGCGTGAVMEALLTRGIQKAIGVDPSPAFVAHAEQRFQHVTADVTFQVGNAMDLRFADGTFDGVVSGLVLNFVPDPDKALAEMRRVAKRGGVVAGYVWDYAGRMEMMRYFWDAAVELDPDRAGSLDEGARFPLCQPDRLAQLFTGAGLAEVETGSIDQLTVFRSFEDYWTPFLGGQAPAPAYAMSLSEERRARLRDRIRAKLPTSADGSIALVARAWTVRGVKA